MIVVDFEDFRSDGASVFLGRERGSLCREAANLDEHDRTGSVVEIHIPDDVYHISSGFFYEMFGPSVRKHGVMDFSRRYSFHGPVEVLEEIDKMFIDYFLRNDRI